MYYWRISRKHVWIFLIQFSVLFLLSIVFISISTYLGMSFKSKHNIDKVEVGFVTMNTEYSDYYNQFGLRTDATGNILFRYFDKDGKTAITTKEIAKDYIQQNGRIDTMMKILSIFLSLQLVATLLLLLMSIFQRRNCLFAILTLISTLLKIFVMYGLTYQLFFVGIVFEVIALVFVLNDLKKINIENKKIANRDQYY